MRIFLAIGLALLCTGCWVETMTSTAIQTENAANAAQSGLAAKGYSEQTVGKAEIQQAINAYNAEAGEYPASLDALVPDYLPQMPKKPDGSAFEYDAQAGKVSN